MLRTLGGRDGADPGRPQLGFGTPADTRRLEVPVFRVAAAGPYFPGVGDAHGSEARKYRPQSAEHGGERKSGFNHFGYPAKRSLTILLFVIGDEPKLVDAVFEHGIDCARGNAGCID